MELLHQYSEDFSLTARIEPESRRIWVEDYQTDRPESLQKFLGGLARQSKAEKIVFPVREKDQDRMQAGGFAREGIIKGYFKGENGHFMASFPDPGRAVSPSLAKEQKMLGEILQRPSALLFKKQHGLITRLASVEDTHSMANLFQQVFASYPSPVYDPEYLKSSIKKGNIFMNAYIRRRLAGTASAEIDWEYSRAELTNCATVMEYRGKGLNFLLLSKIESLCLSLGIKCLYSLARASSYGMNAVLYRLGYCYGGTLVNNCNISGGLENMNIWVRPEQLVSAEAKGGPVLA